MFDCTGAILGAAMVSNTCGVQHDSAILGEYKEKVNQPVFLLVPFLFFLPLPCRYPKSNVTLPVK